MFSEEEVYMPDDDERYEYVLNDSGHIYWGGRRPKPWWFGQVYISIGSDCTATFFVRLCKGLLRTKLA